MASEFINQSEFARQCGVCSTTLASWVREGIVNPHHTTPTGRNFYTKEQVEELVHRSINEDYLSAREFAKRVGVSNSTMSNWISKGLIKPAYVTPNGRMFFTELQCKKLLNED